MSIDIKYIDIVAVDFTPPHCIFSHVQSFYERAVSNLDP